MFWKYGIRVPFRMKRLPQFAVLVMSQLLLFAYTSRLTLSIFVQLILTLTPFVVVLLSRVCIATPIPRCTMSCTSFYARCFTTYTNRVTENLLRRRKLKNTGNMLITFVLYPYISRSNEPLACILSLLLHPLSFSLSLYLSCLSVWMGSTPCHFKIFKMFRFESVVLTEPTLYLRNNNILGFIASTRDRRRFWCGLVYCTVTEASRLTRRDLSLPWCCEHTRLP